MRRILAASILLSPMLFTAVAVASQPKDDSPAPTQSRAISTGVTGPKIIRTTDIVITPEVAGQVQNGAEVVLELNVDKNGDAQDVQVVKSVNPYLDARVVDAVRQFRWRPAKLDNQSIPMDLTLKVVVQH